MTILCTKTPKDFSELKSEIYHFTTNNSKKATKNGGFAMKPP